VMLRAHKPVQTRRALLVCWLTLKLVDRGPMLCDFHILTAKPLQVSLVYALSAEPSDRQTGEILGARIASLIGRRTFILPQAFATCA